MTLPVWAVAALQEHAPLASASDEARMHFDTLRARVEAADTLVATEVARSLHELADEGKTAVFAQAIWAAKYFASRESHRIREAVPEAQRLNAKIRTGLLELASLARLQARLVDDYSLSGFLLPDAADCLSDLSRRFPAWSLISGLPRVIGVSMNTGQPIPALADVLEAFANSGVLKPLADRGEDDGGHWLGDSLSSRKNTADVAHVLLHALSRLKHHPHVPPEFHLSDVGVAALVRTVFGTDQGTGFADKIDADGIGKLRRRA